jgi:hypothetical protein
MEKMHKINKSNILHSQSRPYTKATIGNMLLATFFSNVAALRMECQRNINHALFLTYKTTFGFRQRSQTFTVIVSNNYSRIGGKIGFTIKDKALVINN